MSTQFCFKPAVAVAVNKSVELNLNGMNVELLKTINEHAKIIDIYVSLANQTGQ